MNGPIGRVDGRTQVFGSLCVLVFLVNLGRVIYAPLLEPFRVTFDATAGQVGLLATLAWIGSASLRLPTGYVLTRVPRHRVVLSTGLVLAGLSAFAAAARSIEVLYVGSPRADPTDLATAAPPVRLPSAPPPASPESRVFCPSGRTPV